MPFVLECLENSLTSDNHLEFHTMSDQATKSSLYGRRAREPSLGGRCCCCWPRGNGCAAPRARTGGYRRRRLSRGPRGARAGTRSSAIASPGIPPSATASRFHPCNMSPRYEPFGEFTRTNGQPTLRRPSLFEIAFWPLLIRTRV